jgi:MFS family permease
MQFIFSPVWGRLSDRIGRRPVLLISTAMAVISYVVFALGTRLEGGSALLVFLLSRSLAGVCGANITVGQAYVADVTPVEKRSRSMGLIGMAFGLGFIIGPALGAVSLSYLGVAGPGWVAAAMCLTNLCLAAIFLKESWTPAAEHVQQRPHYEQWKHTLRHPSLAVLIGVYFLATFCFTTFETTLGLVVSLNFGLDIHGKHDAQVVGYLFAFCGVIGAIVQGGLIGKLVDTMGEPKLIALSLILVAAALAPIPFITTWTPLLIMLAILAAGSSMSRPPIFGMLSIMAPKDEQGATMGVAQSVGSFARIIGPLFAGTVYQYHPSYPFVISSILALITGIMASRYLLHHRPQESISSTH